MGRFLYGRMVQFLVLHLPKFRLRVAPFVGKQGSILHFYMYFSDTPTDVDVGKNREWSNSLCDLKTPRWWLCWKTSKMELKSKLVPNSQRSVLISTRRRWWKFMEPWSDGWLVCWFISIIQEIQGPKKNHKECLLCVYKCLQSVSFGNLLAFQTAMICVQNSVTV